MNLPYYAEYLVKQFSRPLTRSDWRTCKKKEADMILEDVSQEKSSMNVLRATLTVRYPFNHANFTKGFAEISNWSHYGRKIALKHKDKARLYHDMIPTNHFVYVHYFYNYLADYSRYESKEIKPLHW